MSERQWLTPNAPSGVLQCRTVFFPEGVDWLAVLSGALMLLTDPNNFEPFGTATPDQAAAAFDDTFDAFSFNGGPCRMIGEIICYAGTTSPDSRWLGCDGASLVRADYPDLFAIVGTIYGSADSAHFNLPDLRSRSGIGAGQGAGLSNYAVGDQAGEETHTLTVPETPSHSHSDTGHTHTEGNALPALSAAIVGVPIPSAIPSVGVTGTGFASITNTGGGGAHNTIHPVLSLNYLIVAQN